MKRPRSIITVTLALAIALAITFTASLGSAGAASVSANKDGFPPAHMMRAKTCHHRCTGGSNLSYHGGTNGVGVETGADRIYLVYWGSQWNNNDPSGEAAIQQNFFNGIGGSSWNNTVTQYCEGVSSGTVYCNGAGTPAVNPKGVLAGVWYDNASSAPSSPTQSDLANEAINAAAHFGNTTATSNTTAQYFINTATGNNSSGFGSQYCAWHDYTTSSYGDIAYTNMPYITDAGSSCGANFVNSGSAGLTDGITIVGGHEFAETETDIYPSSGWVDGSGSEIGDKCAWISSGQGASADITLSTGKFAVQSLWSNAFNSGAGGCVVSY